MKRGRLDWRGKTLVVCVGAGLAAAVLGLVSAPRWTPSLSDVRPTRLATDAQPIGLPAAAPGGPSMGFIPVAVTSSATETMFDGQRAFDVLTRLCAFGARPSGSEGMVRQRDFLKEHFEGLGSEVKFQEFTVRHPILDRDVKLSNMIVPLHPDRNMRVLLCAHYDTRPYPDRDPVPGGKRGVFVGANDGASGVAVLAELARSLHDFDRSFGVDIVLFDGEEFVFVERGKYFLGSEYFAKDYVKSPPPYRYRWGVLLDMVGDAKLGIFQERHSVTWPDTRVLVQEIWGTAARLGIREFIPRVEYLVEDDHLALRNIAGIPTCDIIDFYYPEPVGHQSYWHTRADTPDKCAPDSLAKVGTVLLEWLKNARVEEKQSRPEP